MILPLGQAGEILCHLALWLSLVLVAIVAGVFLGYGTLLRLVRGCRGAQPVTFSDEKPEVTLIISVYNEENVLTRKLENVQAIDYPPERLKVLVVSDASTDQSDAIVRDFSRRDPRIRLVRQAERQGKTAGLNRALREVDTPFVVFTDANSMFDRDALAYLVGHFADPRVGYVVGAALYSDDPSSEGARTEGRYWDRELQIKELESQVSSVVGGDGAIYATRTPLYEPLRIQDINDFVNPLQTIAKGYRGVFEPRARCWEETAGTIDGELRRKRRIVNRSFAGLLKVRQVLNPLRHGWFAVQVWMHKLLRWLSPFLLGTALLCATLASATHAWLRVPVAVLWGGLLVLAAATRWTGLARRVPFLAEAAYKFGVLLASARGVLDTCRGHVATTWQPARDGADTSAPASEHRRILIATGVWLALPLVAVVAVAFSSSTSWRIVFTALAGLGMALAPLAYLGLSALYPSVPASSPASSPAPKRQSACDSAAMPVMPARHASVTLLIVAYNEEAVIEAKLENTLKLRYSGPLEIVVASDASDDATDDIVTRFGPQGIHLLANETRRGKAGLVAHALTQLDSDIVVVSDANAFYDSDVVERLIARFADSTIGVVTGSVVLEDSQTKGCAAAAQRGPAEEVWSARLEKLLVEKESLRGSCVGVDGAMVAIRRELWSVYREGVILDDLVLAVETVNRGYRVVFEPAAHGRESAAATFWGEFERRARIFAGVVQLYRERIGLPTNRSGLVGRFLAHKVWRWSAPVFAPAFLVCVLITWGPQIGLTAALVLAAAIFVALTLFRDWRFAISKLGSLVVYQLAAIAGLARGLRGRQRAAWKRTERETEVVGTRRR